MNPTTVRASTALVGPELEARDQVTVVIENGRISDVATDSNGPVDVDLPGVTLLPGFIDTHVHVGFYPPATVLAGGITTVRDLGWPAERILPLVSASQEPSFDGPAIVAAGPMLTCPGGYPTRAGWAPPGTGRVVTDADDARAAVRERVRDEASIVKVALNPVAGPTLDVDLLRAICDEAHSHGMQVTAHIYGLDELEKAIESGVDELAHMLMSPEEIPDVVIEQMVKANMRVVPTLSIHRWRTKRKAMLNLAGFVEAGGLVIYGTDLGNSGPRPGIDRKEINRMERSGMSGAAIIKSATVDAAHALRLETKGVIGAGYDADLIAVEGDPVDAPVQLNYVRFKMRAGIVRAVRKD